MMTRTPSSNSAIDTETGPEGIPHGTATAGAGGAGCAAGGDDADLDAAANATFGRKLCRLLGTPRFTFFLIVLTVQGVGASSLGPYLLIYIRGELGGSYTCAGKQPRSCPV